MRMATVSIAWVTRWTVSVAGTKPSGKGGSSLRAGDRLGAAVGRHSDGGQALGHPVG